MTTIPLSLEEIANWYLIQKRTDLFCGWTCDLIIKSVSVVNSFSM